MCHDKQNQTIGPCPAKTLIDWEWWAAVAVFAIPMVSLFGSPIYHLAN